MIARLRGTVVEKSVNELVIDCHGVGYAVLVSIATASQAVVGSELVLHTYLAVREDAMQLFGFSSHQERHLFLQLTSISGIGGKTALTILSATTTSELHNAVITKNALFLQRLPGIGKKTAERIIVELYDKIDAGAIIVEGGETSTQTSVQNDTIAAMVALGYNRQHAERAVRKVLSESAHLQLTTDGVLRQALQFMQ